MKNKTNIVKAIGSGKDLQSYIEIAEQILAGTVQIPYEFEKYLRILRAVRWETHDRVPLPISEWTVTQRNQLINMFISMAQANQSPTGWFIPPNNLAQNLSDTDYPTTILKKNDAWRIFISHVANSLYMEISGRLTWSMTAYSPDDLAILLDSRSFFTWDPYYNGYFLDDFVTGHITPTDARCLSSFIKIIGPRGLIASNATDTIANLLEWCRHNLVHFSGQFQAANVNNIWNYRGFPPIAEMITMTYPHYSAGCWGTTGFIQALLRIVNIPVKSHILGFTTSAHDSCHFTRQNTYLSHSDDCYSLLIFSTPPFPAKELMIDQDTYDAWYQYPEVPADECQKNIGRQTFELALKYLPDYLLEMYCTDLSNNVPPQNGSIMSLFSVWYTYQDLLNLDLWNRLQAKVNSFGGCQNIPHSYDTAQRPLLPWVP
jgi:hypothetical protein